MIHIDEAPNNIIQNLINGDPNTFAYHDGEKLEDHPERVELAYSRHHDLRSLIIVN